MSENVMFELHLNKIWDEIGKLTELEDKRWLINKTLEYMWHKKLWIGTDGKPFKVFDLGEASQNKLTY